MRNTKTIRGIKNFLRLTIILFFLAVVSCNQSPDIPRREIEAWGIDINGTTADYKKPDTAFFRTIIMERIERGIDITIAVTAIGNPTDRAFVIQHFRYASQVDPNEKPSTRDAQQATIDSLKKDNIKLLDQFIIDVQREVFELKQAKRTEKLLTDLTDLNGFLHKSEVLLREPSFGDSSYVKRISILSDCEQDLDNNGQRDAVVHELQKVSGLNLFLIGCKNLKPFEGLHYTEFSSIDDVKIFLNSNKQ